MFSIYKVTNILQTVPNLASPTREQTSKLPGPSFFKSGDKETPQDKREAGGKNQDEKNKKDRDNKNNKNDNDNNNGGGGFLEPIIEDLQGFLKGRRQPVMTHCQI